jgi:DNA-binding NarL/FixJ family response regulator
MASPKRPKITLSAAERHDLLTLIRPHKTPQHFSFRAQIILRLDQGQCVTAVAKHLGTSRRTVQLW